MCRTHIRGRTTEGEACITRLRSFLTLTLPLARSRNRAVCVCERERDSVPTSCSPPFSHRFVVSAALSLSSSLPCLVLPASAHLHGPRYITGKQRQERQGCKGAHEWFFPHLSPSSSPPSVHCSSSSPCCGCSPTRLVRCDGAQWRTTGYCSCGSLARTSRTGAKKGCCIASCARMRS